MRHLSRSCLILLPFRLKELKVFNLLDQLLRTVQNRKQVYHILKRLEKILLLVTFSFVLFLLSISG